MLGPVACSVVSHERDAQPRTLNCRGNPPFMNAVCEIRKSLFFSYNIVAFFFPGLTKITMILSRVSRLNIVYL